MSLNVEPPEVTTAVDVNKETSIPPSAAKDAATSNIADGADSSDDDGSAYELEKNPFLDPDVAAYWKGVYENASYECRHVFDPTFTWSAEEERALVRKLDWRVCLWACVMFFGLQVDRGNLVQAVSDNLLPELGLTSNGTILYEKI